MQLVLYFRRPNTKKGNWRCWLTLRSFERLFSRESFDVWYLNQQGIRYDVEEQDPENGELNDAPDISLHAEKQDIAATNVMVDED